MAKHGRCPACGTYNVPLNDDGTLMKHRIWSIQLETWIDCFYEGYPV